MNVADLRAALHEQADTVAEHDTGRRVAQVHARVRVARRRRAAGAAALTVAVLALVSVVATLPEREAGPADPGPTSEPAPLPTIEHENFLSHSGEFDLVAAEIGGRGQNTLDLTIPAHREELHVTMVCYGPSGPANGYWVSGYGGDRRPERPHSYWCGDDPSVPAVPGVFGEAPGPWHYDEGFTLQPANDPRTIHVELTQEVDEHGIPLDRADAIGDYVVVGHPDVVLGIAVYTVADPVATVAGTEIRPLVGLAGQDYAYADHRESGRGERQLTWHLPPSTAVRYYDVVADDAIDPDKPGPGVLATLDGTACQSGYGFARFRAGGCLLTPGVPHTITVTTEGDPLKDTVLGIVLYEQTG